MFAAIRTTSFCVDTGLWVTPNTVNVGTVYPIYSRPAAQGQSAALRGPGGGAAATRQPVGRPSRPRSISCKRAPAARNGQANVVFLQSTTPLTQSCVGHCDKLRVANSGRQYNTGSNKVQIPPLRRCSFEFPPLRRCS